MLWMVQRVYYGPITNEENQHLPDLSAREWWAAAPLVAAAIVMGVVPTILANVSISATPRPVIALAHSGVREARCASSSRGQSVYFSRYGQLA